MNKNRSLYSNVAFVIIRKHFPYLVHPCVIRYWDLYFIKNGELSIQLHPLVSLLVVWSKLPTSRMKRTADVWKMLLYKITWYRWVCAMLHLKSNWYYIFWGCVSVCKDKCKGQRDSPRGTTRVLSRQPHAPAAFIPRGILGTHFLEVKLTPGHMVLSVSMRKIPVTDVIGSRDRPTSSTEP